MKLLPVPLTLAAALLPRGRGAVALQALAAADTPPREAAARSDADAQDWRSACQRLRARDEDESPDDQTQQQPFPPLVPFAPLAPPIAALVPRDLAPEVAEVRAVAPATPTTERIAALHQLAEANPAAVPVARTWQVELPAAVGGAAWQLHVGQAQPLAPLNLELRVPPVAQLQARQQLSDLDKRLRDAGHDVLRPRVRDASRSAKRSRPVDEVDS